MARVLISFLGAGHYRPCRYRFDSAVSEPSRFFPQSLLRHLTDKRQQPIDRLLLCGTATSNWRGLVDMLDHPELDPTGAPERQAPIDLEELRAVERAATERLSTQVQARLISFGTAQGEQVAFIEQMAAGVDVGDAVQFDMTHGLRHLTLLALLAALAIETGREAEIEEIWYGAFDLREQGIAPVMQLRGLFEILDWTRAITVFEQTGDVALFGKLVDNESQLDLGKRIRRAAFHEQVAGSGSARASIREALDGLKELDGGISALFRGTVERRFDWVGRPESAADGLRLAREALEKENEVHAVTSAFEAVLARATTAAFGKEARRYLQGISKPLGEVCRRHSSHQLAGAFARAFLDLRDIRNAIVHRGEIEGGGGGHRRALRSALDGPEELRVVLKPILTTMQQPVPASLADGLRRAAERSFKDGKWVDHRHE